MTLVPSEFTSACTLLFRPLMTDEIVITVVTPITMPRIVNPERSLFVRRVSSAIRTDSLESLSFIESKSPFARLSLLRPGSYLFVAQRFNWVEVCGFPCRVDTENQPDCARHSETDNCPGTRHSGRKTGDQQTHEDRDKGTDQHPDH